MPIRLGAPELMIVLVLVILLFGAGRISKVSEELGRGIRSFREGLQTQEVEQEDRVENQIKKQ